MKEIGEKLKEARLAKNISLDEASKVLKIRKTQLEYIEEGNTSAFSDTFYVKYFVREYANYLGLDAKEIFAELEQAIENKNALNTSKDKSVRIRKVNVEKETTNSSKKQKLKKSKKPYRVSSSKYDHLTSNLFIFGIVFILLFSMWYVFTSTSFGQSLFQSVENKTITGKVPSEDNQDEVDDTEKPSGENPSETEKPTIPAQTITFVSKTGSDVFNYDITNAETTKLKVEFFGKSWLGIKDGNKSIFDKIADKGTIFEIELKEKQTSLVIGAHQFVEVYINDVKVEYQEHNKNKYQMVLNFK